MIELNEPQIWTLIGVFAASTFGMCTLMSTMFMRTMTNGFESLRVEMNAGFKIADIKFEQIDRRFDQVDQRFEQVDQRFEQVDRRLSKVEERIDQVNTKIDHLDRDVQALVRKVFPEYPEAG